MYTIAPLPMPEPNYVGFAIYLVVALFVFYQMSPIFTWPGRDRLVQCALLCVLMLSILGLATAYAYWMLMSEREPPVNKPVNARFVQFVPTRTVTNTVKSFTETKEQVYVQLELESNKKSVLVPFHKYGEMPPRVVLYWNPAPFN